MSTDTGSISLLTRNHRDSSTPYARVCEKMISLGIIWPIVLSMYKRIEFYLSYDRIEFYLSYERTEFYLSYRRIEFYLSYERTEFYLSYRRIEFYLSWCQGPYAALQTALLSYEESEL